MPFGPFIHTLLHHQDEGGREDGREEEVSSIHTLLQEEGGREGGREEGVFYLSQQNDNMRQEFPMLLSEDEDEDEDEDEGEEGREEGRIPAAGFPIAHQAFGNAPDAVNLWIGDSKSLSSLHKDPYENMYAVLKGEKVGEKQKQ
jgi:hypothetical protein